MFFDFDFCDFPSCMGGKTLVLVLECFQKLISVLYKGRVFEEIVIEFSVRWASFEVVEFKCSFYCPVV